MPWPAFQEFIPVLTSGPVLTLAGVIATTVGVWTVFLTTRAAAKKDILSSVDSKFSALIDQLQEERDDLNQIIERQRETIDKHRDTIERLLAESQDARSECRSLLSRIPELEHVLQSMRLSQV